MNEKAFTLEYKKLEDAIRTALNAAQLPLVVKLMVVRDAENALNAYINRLMTEEDGDVHSDGDSEDRGTSCDVGDELH